MSQHNKARSFNRPSSQKQALMRSLVKSLIEHERISTTLAKAKELRPIAEKLITRARTDTVANRRIVSSRLGEDKAIVKKLFGTIAPRYKGRTGGYLRIVKRTKKRADAALMAYIAFVE